MTSVYCLTLCLCEQDLREECIKLKMLVFDLERQNRALCELFQQKLPNQPAAHSQVSHLIHHNPHTASSGLTPCVQVNVQCQRKQVQLTVL